MAALEIDLPINLALVPKTPSEGAVPQRSTTRRDPNALAASIALHTAENGMALDQVASMWAVQKGHKFVDKLLQTPIYQDLPEKEKERIRHVAARAVSGELIEDMQLTAPTQGVHDKRWQFWNAGYSVF